MGHVPGVNQRQITLNNSLELIDWKMLSLKKLHQKLYQMFLHEKV